MGRLLLLLLLIALSLRMMMLHADLLLLLLLLLLMKSLFVSSASLLLATSATRHAIRIAAGTGEIISVKTTTVGLFPATIRAGYASDTKTILRCRV